MKKNILMTFIILLFGTLSGCGSNKISNDRIIISDYGNWKFDKGAEDEMIWQALLEKCTVKTFPQEELSQRVDELNAQYEYVAYYEGKEASELIEEIHNKTTEELAKEQLTKEYAITLIAETERIVLTDEKYEKKLKIRAEQNGMDTAEEYESLFGREQLYANFLEESVLEVLREKGGEGK